jgi:hypothetical protein
MPYLRTRMSAIVSTGCMTDDTLEELTTLREIQNVNGRTSGPKPRVANYSQTQDWIAG